MKTFFGVLLATGYGLGVRLVFGLLGDFMGIMSISFLFLTPIIIGFLTVYVIPKRKVGSRVRAFFMPWLTSLLILMVTIALDIEGTICWIMIFPVFAVMAGVGGVLAYRIKKRKEVEDLLDDWEKPDTLGASLILFVPMILGVIEGDRTQVPEQKYQSESIVISGSTDQVWNALISIDKINKEEMNSPLSDFLGFPKHIKTRIDTLMVGGRRTATYESDLFFEETIVEIDPGKKLVLDIHADPNKIPPKVMDEHILIGGEHVDIYTDTYSLIPGDNGTCQLTLTSKFMINTSFNWYASIWAKFLMKDILKSELNLIKNRVES